jgi:glucose-6-phosphate isomerase
MSRVTLNFSLSKTDITEITNYKAKIKTIHDQLHSGRLESTGWVDYPKNVSDTLLDEMESVARKIRKESTAFVIIGIGGSFLGARACTQMILDQYRNEVGHLKVYFAGWNLSGTYHKALLDHLKNEEISICVVSKSGKTAETLAAFNLFKKLLKEKYGKDYNKHIYVVTDKVTGALRKEVKENKYVSFELDKDIGGRYSFLTPAGLFPVAVAGIDIKRVMKGAKEAYEHYSNPNVAENQCYQYAAIRRLLNQKHNRTVEIYEYYEPRLTYFAEWLKQLYGESEGKEYLGIYPSSLLLTRDLHSLGQFLQEGSQIFFETVFKIKQPPADIMQDGMLSFNAQNNAVMFAVNKAHHKNNTPIITFEMEDLQEESFGYAVYFFEKSCAVSSMLLGVDPFNQPGVEIYKKNLSDLISKITREQI